MTSALAEAAPVGLFTLDGAGRVGDVNPAFARLTGVTAAEAAGRPLRSFLTQASQVLYALKVETALMTLGRADEIALEVQREARALPVLLTLAPPTGAAGVRHGVLFSAPERRAYELELIAARQAAEAAREARDLLLREVYHRVKNNLQTIDSLLLLQARRLKDPEAVTALHAMRRRVFALGLVHHQLMGSSDLRTFDVGAFLRELTHHLETGDDGRAVRIDVDAAAAAVGLDFAIPLGLIVTELVTGALEAGAGGGVVSVAFHRVDEGEARLRVTGPGGPGGGLADTPAAPTLGQSIVDGLVRQLGGRQVRSPVPTFADDIYLPLPRNP